jgi:hypothetical protein
MAEIILDQGVPRIVPWVHFGVHDRIDLLFGELDP